MIAPYQPDNQLPWLQQAKPASVVTAEKTQPETATEPKKDGDDYWGDDGFSFGDLVDIINPLQHLPFVSTLYRKITGDEISQGARFAGGMVYGGAIGMVSNVVQAVIEDVSGKSAEEHLVAMFAGDDKPADKKSHQPKAQPDAFAHNEIMKPLPQLYQAYATSVAKKEADELYI